MRNVLLAMFVIATLLLGCTQIDNSKKPAPLGSTVDEHGCNPTAGYEWCEYKSKCIRSWEEDCTQSDQLDGSDRDEHGCIGSAGYVWCQSMNKCIQPFEQPCLTVVTEDFAPFNYINSKNEIDGQSVRIVNEIMKRTNQQSTIKLLSWQDAYEMAKSGPNTILFSIAKTNERENEFKWVGPIGFWEYGFYAHKNTSLNIQSLESAKNVKSICVVKDDARHQILMQSNFTNLVLSQSDVQCAQMIANSQVDLWLGSSTNFFEVLNEANLSTDEFNYLHAIRQSDVYIAFSNDTSDSLVNKWQETLGELKRDGTIKTIDYLYRPSLKKTLSLKSATCTFKHADMELSNAMSVLENSLSTLIFTQKQSSNDPILANAVSNSKWDQAKSFLMLQSKVYPQGVHWYSNSDGNYYTLNDGLTTQNLKDREYFSEVMSGQSTISDILVSKSTAKLSIVIASPIRSANSIVGALGSSLYLSDMSAKVSNAMNLPNNLYFFALDSNEQIVLHSEPANIGKKMSGIFEKLNSSKNNQFEFVNDFGQKQIAVFAEPNGSILKELNWTLFVSADEQINDQICIIAEDLPPYNFVDEKGFITGQSVDLLRKMMIRADIPAPIEMMQWTNAYNLALKEKNTAIFSITRTPAREDLFIWVGPIAHSKDIFYANKNSNFKINLLEDAKRVKSICAYKDDSKALYLLSNGFTNLVYEKDDLACIKKLASNQVDLWIADYRSVPYLLTLSNIDASVILPIYDIQKKDYYIAFSKDTSQKTITRYKEALNAMQSDGTYDSLIRQYEK